MFSRVLYKDEELTLAARWFGLGHIYVESNGYSVSAYRSQRRFLARVMMRLEQRGHKVRPPDSATCLFFRAYADALMKRQASYPWLNWFERGSERVAGDFIALSRATATRAER